MRLNTTFSRHGREQKVRERDLMAAWLLWAIM